MAHQTPRSDAMLDLLTGPDVAELLAAALAPAGAQLLGWSVRDVDHRPGRRTTVSYTVKVSWPGGPREEILGATATPRNTDGAVAADDRLIVTDGGHEIQVWRFPFDPELPALAAMCFPDTATKVLRALGVDADRVQLKVLSYRPRKRAVVQVGSGSGRWFVKVLRPAAVDDMRRRHTLLTDAGLPVPVCRGWSDDGLLVLSELPGMSLRSALDDEGAAACEPGELVSMLDGFPDELLRLPRRQPWADHAAHYAGVIASALPAEAAGAYAIATEVAAALRRYDDGPDEPTHGDFYASQLMVGEGRVTGLLDVDTAGPGRRVDDLSCMLAHLSLLTVIDTADARGARGALRSWIPEFDRRVDPSELRVRTAGVIVSLATGPFRTQEADWERATSARLALAQLWLNSADGARTPF
ncbi:phosphotransferase [Phytoactinopolyspora endophytica]|uniref:phosphotransferase n=1 Tax=Phytoactinopolyspora endophytica TaxID=1642495 RepID=UPI00197B9444|nr:phosphotransferase [Phytoactinopolyspora endophytica]